MKYSIYNILFPYGTKMILFNTLADKSLVLEKPLADVLEHYRHKITELRSIHPEFYKALVDGNFIVMDTCNEVEDVEKLRVSTLSDKTQYHLTINPTLDCNFNCWYCYETKVKGSEMSKENVLATISFIDNVLKENPKLKRFHIYFFGGEPLLKYSEIMKPILDAFVEKISKTRILPTIQITTNGVLISEEIIAELKNYKTFTSFQITFDGFMENHNKSRFSKIHPKSYKIILNNVLTLIRNGFFVTLRVNYTQKNVGDLQLILDEFKDISPNERNMIIYTPVRIWQDEPKFVTKESCEHLVMNEFDGVVIAMANQSVEYAKSLGMQIMPINSINSVRYPCKHSYVNAASINYNGDVFKCCARAFNEENREGILQKDGVIIWRKDTNERILRKRTGANKPCISCVLFPICGGGCVQTFKDFDNIEYCLYRFDEYSKIEAAKRYVSLTQLTKHEF